MNAICIQSGIFMYKLTSNETSQNHTHLPTEDVHIFQSQSLGPINFVYITGRFLFIKGKCSCQWLGNKLFTVWKTTDFLRWLDDFACFGVLLKKQSYIKQFDFKQICLEHFRVEGLWDYLVKRHDFKDEKIKTYKWRKCIQVYAVS